LGQPDPLHFFFIGMKPPCISILGEGLGVRAKPMLREIYSFA